MAVTGLRACPYVCPVTGLWVAFDRLGKLAARASGAVQSGMGAGLCLCPHGTRVMPVVSAQTGAAGRTAPAGA